MPSKDVFQSCKFRRLPEGLSHHLLCFFQLLSPEPLLVNLLYSIELCSSYRKQPKIGALHFPCLTLKTYAQLRLCSLPMDMSQSVCCSQLCKEGRLCHRRVCFFAHDYEQLRQALPSVRQSTTKLLLPPAWRPQMAACQVRPRSSLKYFSLVESSKPAGGYLESLGTQLAA